MQTRMRQGQNHDLEFNSPHDRHRSRNHRGHHLYHMALLLSVAIPKPSM
jgi:hypothetical protein